MREVLEPIFGASGAVVAQYMVTLIVILGLVGLVVFLIRRFSMGGVSHAARGRLPRLAIVDALPVDNRRRLVLIRRDNVEHLVLIGGPTDLVVEPSIIRTRVSQRPAQQAQPGAESPPAATPRQATPEPPPVIVAPPPPEPVADPAPPAPPPRQSPVRAPINAQARVPPPPPPPPGPPAASPAAASPPALPALRGERARAEPPIPFPPRRTLGAPTQLARGTPPRIREPARPAPEQEPERPREPAPPPPSSAPTPTPDFEELTLAGELDLVPEPLPRSGEPTRPTKTEPAALFPELTQATELIDALDDPAYRQRSLFAPTGESERSPTEGEGASAPSGAAPKQERPGGGNVGDLEKEMARLLGQISTRPRK